MKKVFSNVGNYIDKKKAEHVADNKAWGEARTDIAKADAMYDAALEVLNKGWEDLESSCYVKDEIKSDAMGDAAADSISTGMEAVEDASIALDKAEAAALALAKGNHKVMLHKTKYMPKPEPIRFGPYI